ncbi:hypothetical protein ACIQZI_17825 [Peribacillus sp. NPDC096379]|uniref:hypothetical protein n=1 Tax=Peribacillus sp. NPDC096379 TaxID=3364393 RepID=UPI00381A7076
MFEFALVTTIFIVKKKAFDSGLACAIGIPVVFFHYLLMGYYTAVMLDASIAGCMVSVAGVIFGWAFLFSPSQGLVTTYMKRRRLSAER